MKQAEDGDYREGHFHFLPTGPAGSRPHVATGRFSHHHKNQFHGRKEEGEEEEDEEEGGEEEEKEEETGLAGLHNLCVHSEL